MIRIKNLSKSFNNSLKGNDILHNINLSVPNESWCTIMGPSGAGKSTLLNCISGLLRPNEGTVHIKDTQIFELSEKELSDFRRKYIGFVFQDFKLLPYYSVLDNVTVPLLYDEEKITLENRAKNLLTQVGIDESLFNRLPRGLSGGEKQRVAIARALISEPDLLLCDEPTGNLDSDTRDQITSLLTKIKQNGQTIIVVTHDEEVAKCGDTCYQLKERNLHNKELIK